MPPIRTLPLLLSLLLLQACAVRSAHEFSMATTPDGQGEVAAIEEASRRFSAAYMAGDVETMTSLYTRDAVIFPGNSAAIRGPEAIRRYWALPPGQRVVLHRATPTEIRVDGRHAYDHGVYEIVTERNGEASPPFHGKYVIVWRREPEGWRMHLDMWNSGPQPPR